MPDNGLSGQYRKNIKPGLMVMIVLKEDQPTGVLTQGLVKDILTKKDYHPRGIKVRLDDDSVGRVQHIIRIKKSDKEKRTQVKNKIRNK